ncbi:MULTISPECIES: NINE protein [unclassified Actinomyces]|uniref:TM2 domain-containing protein n=1 Tax=unclassified Actinomyces TaxID=2609248 RepID=UPI0020173698|nr:MULTISPECIES: NINE protein [unclassified Actinomyces]MCL3777789.1 TM2 domain-containing protein [Actinomyces sp. AC-20-1]MCL3790693.1 TM2 domain-containing protein [Actinomyces sp. 187325]MCL3792703.1 TM2 domain-containing protein [Actinomyces sp. 186855]MCL3795422.1 TM2 domain-containing protein [Actinomyces sp. 217892]
MTSSPTPSGQDPYSPVPGAEPYPGGAPDGWAHTGQPYAGQGYQGQARPPYQGQAYQQYQAPDAPYQGVYAQPGVALRSRMAAGLLAILLGGLGIHNFYLGRTGRGVAQLLLSVLSFGTLSWVTWIWAVIEGILILSSQPGQYPWGVDANGYPLQP